METKYIAVYKCRICKKNVIKDFVKDEKEAIMDAFEKAKELNTFAIIHACSDSNIGVADFQGYIKIQEKDSTTN